MNNKTYAVVDLETTGHSSVKGDRIIQIAIVLMKNGEVKERYNRFVDPKQTIPPFIRQLTNIHNEDVEHAPPFEEIASEVRELLEGTVFVAHNTDFDLPFLQHEFKRCGIQQWSGKQIDTVELTKIVFPTLPSYRLQDVAEYFDIALPSAHRADDDAEATAYLLKHCMEKLSKIPVQTLEQLHAKSFMLKSDIAFLLYDVLKTARKNMHQPTYPTFRGIAYRPKKQTTIEKAAEIPYPTSKEEKTTLLTREFDAFDYRSSQYDFMDTVWETLQKQTEVAAEVPTGIGKTIGYLLPAAVHALKTNKPIVISTYTNYLVDKIVDSEMDKIRRMLDVPLTAVILKGKEQYISLEKLYDLSLIKDQSYDETFTMMQVLVWLTETTTGDLNELSVSGGGQLFIDRIRKRSIHVAKDEREADFFTNQLQAAKTAHIIVTNHAMLLNDTERQDKIFTNIGGLIVDEAHQVVHMAMKLQQTVFSYTGWKYVLGQLNGASEHSLFTKMMKMIRRLHLYEVREMHILTSYERFLRTFDEVTERMALFHLPEKQKGASTRSTYMLKEYRDGAKGFQHVSRLLDDYLATLHQVTAVLTQHASQLTKSERAHLIEWRYWVDELVIKAGEWVELFLTDESYHSVVWIERDQRSLPSSLVARRCPLNAATVVRALIEPLVAQSIGIVWTSGTLTVGEQKRYIPTLLGLPHTTPTIQFPAPATFYDGARFYMIDDMPDIQQVPQSEYIEEVATAIIEATIATGGRLFVLFTSKDMLRKTYDLIIDSDQLSEYALFAQGITSGSRMKLLKSFHQFKQSVLFGTSSFWEGVDIPGDALSAVIVVRLPFTSPEEPYFKARAEQLTAEGKNAFQQYALPEAIMRMRQGFGRLIRSSQDQGAFIVLDRRIETKSYGQQFIDALPELKIRKVPLHVMVKELENCYNKQR